MEIPDTLKLNAEDVRRLSTNRLEALTGLAATNFSSWTHKRGISERNLERIAEKLHISKSELLRGIELRREDAIAARDAETKATAFTEFLAAITVSNSIESIATAIAS